MATEKLLQDKQFQEVCFTMVKRIQSEIYNKPMGYGQKPEDVLFFLKGGNAAIMLLEDEKPYKFVSDFDTTLLINPEKYSDDYFITILKLAIYAAVSAINSTSEFGIGFLHILDAYKRSGFGKLTDTKEEKTLPHFVKPSMYTPIQNLLEKAFDVEWNNKYIPVKMKDDVIKQEWLKSNIDCPFEVEVIPDLLYGYQSTGLTLIKIKTRTSPSVELIDISIPRKEYPLYKLEWDIVSSGHLVAKDKIALTNNVYTLFDQRLAASINTRENKKIRRTQRANKLSQIVNRNNLQDFVNDLPNNYKGILKNNLNRKIVGGKSAAKAVALEPTLVGGLCPCMLKGGKAATKVAASEPAIAGGYRATKRNLFYLNKWKKGKPIGFTMRSSLKAKGLIPRSNGTYKVSNKYKK